MDDPLYGTIVTSLERLFRFILTYLLSIFFFCLSRDNELNFLLIFVDVQDESSWTIRWYIRVAQLTTSVQLIVKELVESAAVIHYKCSR